ncbi:pectate lyase [Actinophytocola xinjiangensis]|uniref:Pectate lyase n=1 Tax=Actinophytocola xinjiangensis TaxID=485602 RepID=A0A7Z0WP59_9PSEU|nr:pectate lyase [Actinophytocola xinjiangensis]OLF12166.1 pectate lyase [Actinophytocola xinjiangensis]
MRTLPALAATLVTAALCWPASATAEVSLGRQVLAPNDGWASEGAGTTGGSAAPAANVHVVDDRAGLVAALAAPAPRIVYVRGRIDGDTDDAGRPLDCDDYAAPGYTLDGYLDAYDPDVWGRETEPSGPLEDARVASAANQTARMKLKVGSDTTIVGLGRHAVLEGVNLHVDRADNVIIRNLTFVDAADCFPRWDPTDGASGEWNSLYDNVSVTGSTHVWVEGNTFTDGDNPDSAQPIHFGRPYQVHDGQLDLTNGSDLITVSWNAFTGHDKTMLIGSTNNPATDRGRLNVTVHHNLFDTTLQRLPRVRFGQVHVYNNHYRVSDDLVYALGVGVESGIVAQANVFTASRDLAPSRLVYDWGGTALTARDNLLRTGHRAVPVDLVAEYNAANDPDLGTDAGWEPVRHTRIDAPRAVPALVDRFAGADSH